MYYFTYYIEPILAMIFCMILIVECWIIIKLNIRTFKMEKKMNTSVLLTAFRVACKELSTYEAQNNANDSSEFGIKRGNHSPDEWEQMCVERALDKKKKAKERAKWTTTNAADVNI